jgi:tetrahydromethanopterin S-methyltransferase subunit B
MSLSETFEQVTKEVREIAEAFMLGLEPTSLTTNTFYYGGREIVSWTGRNFRTEDIYGAEWMFELHEVPTELLCEIVDDLYVKIQGEKPI